MSLNQFVDPEYVIDHEDKYTAADLSELDTICSGHTADLKMEYDDQCGVPTRVWLSRCGIADGAPYNDGVCVEKCINGRWTEIDNYEG